MLTSTFESFHRHLSPWAGFGVFCFYAVVAIAVAAVALCGVTRDSCQAAAMPWTTRLTPTTPISPPMIRRPLALSQLAGRRPARRSARAARGSRRAAPRAA